MLFTGASKVLWHNSGHRMRGGILSGHKSAARGGAEVDHCTEASRGLAL